MKSIRDLRNLQSSFDEAEKRVLFVILIFKVIKKKTVQNFVKTDVDLKRSRKFHVIFWSLSFCIKRRVKCEK